MFNSQMSEKYHCFQRFPYYKKFGFEYSHRIEDFFIKNYDHVMIEDGKQLKDMVYLKIDYKKMKT